MNFSSLALKFSHRNLRGIHEMNRPFPSFKNPHSFNEAKCKTFLVKMIFYLHDNKKSFSQEWFSLGLVLKQRLAAYSKVQRVGSPE